MRRSSVPATRAVRGLREKELQAVSDYFRDLRSAGDIVTVRQRVRQLAISLGLTVEDISALTTETSSLARSIMDRAEGKKINRVAGTAKTGVRRLKPTAAAR